MKRSRSCAAAPAPSSTRSSWSSSPSSCRSPKPSSQKDGGPGLLPALLNCLSASAPLFSERTPCHPCLAYGPYVPVQGSEPPDVLTPVTGTPVSVFDVIVVVPPAVTSTVA